MRVVDRQIRTVARAIGDESPWGIHPIAKDSPPYRRNGAAGRASRRYANIRAAVRVLAALDTDIIDRWTELVSDDIGFTTDRYVELPEDMQNTRRHGVQVTVRRLP